MRITLLCIRLEMCDLCCLLLRYSRICKHIINNVITEFMHYERSVHILIGTQYVLFFRVYSVEDLYVY